jgi:hypothetical protein
MATKLCFDEANELRIKYDQFPMDAVGEISNLWQEYNTFHFTEEQFERRIKKIANKYGLPEEDVDNYYWRYSSDTPESIVIFYDQTRWVQGVTCADSRANGQMLPKGSIPIGMITEKVAVLRTPCLNRVQKNQLMSEVQLKLVDMWRFHDIVGELLDNGFVVFD